MKPNVSPLERAFELAATGLFSTVSEIKLKLMREGYFYEQVDGPELARQLVAVMANARNGPARSTRPHTKKGG